MDEIIKQFLVNSPTIAILLIALVKVYGDWQADRKTSGDERAALNVSMIALETQVRELKESIEKLTAGVTKLQ